MGGANHTLGTFPLYDAVGYGLGNTVLAVVMPALYVLPITVYLTATHLGGR